MTQAPLKLGPHALRGRVLLAPMAGISDQPFRRLCRQHGAALTTSEMLHADQRLWHTRKSSQRIRMDEDEEVRSIQIAGAEPAMLADAARACEELGAQLVDINMGCPAKKVCNKLAGSALLTDPELVQRILTAVVGAVTIPVTLKIRTGPCPETRNALEIAAMAEDCGIQALVIHGRTRADRFRGEAEYDTIGQVKAQVSIPVIANGDIHTPEDAARVLRLTEADGVMIGRAAQGNPWLFAQVQRFLDSGEHLPGPQPDELGQTLVQHLAALEDFYGPVLGPRIGRKHIGWYLQRIAGGTELRQTLMPLTEGVAQRDRIRQWFENHQPTMADAA
ncbi:MAG: tRNA dihydrouridine synthase DusB [Pseudomonadota bacterium]